MISTELELMQALVDAQADVDAALAKFGAEWLGGRKPKKPANPIGNQGPAIAAPQTAMPPPEMTPQGY